MRHLVIVPALVLMASATAAYAGEGNGDPFPGPDASVTSPTNAQGIVSSSDDPFHYYNHTAAQSTTNAQLSADHADDPYGFKTAGVAAKMPMPSVGPQDDTATAAAQGTQRDRQSLAQHTGSTQPSQPSPRG